MSRPGVQQHLRSSALFRRSSVECLAIQLQHPCLRPPPSDGSNARPAAAVHTVCSGVNDRHRWLWAATPPQGARREQGPPAQQVELGAPNQPPLDDVEAVEVPSL
jgi:hypothetical protein